MNVQRRDRAGGQSVPPVAIFAAVRCAAPYQNCTVRGSLRLCVTARHTTKTAPTAQRSHELVCAPDRDGNRSQPTHMLNRAACLLPLRPSVFNSGARCPGRLHHDSLHPSGGPFMISSHGRTYQAAFPRAGIEDRRPGHGDVKVARFGHTLSHLRRQDAANQIESSSELTAPSSPHTTLQLSTVAPPQRLGEDFDTNRRPHGGGNMPLVITGRADEAAGPERGTSARVSTCST